MCLLHSAVRLGEQIPQWPYPHRKLSILHYHARPLSNPLQLAYNLTSADRRIEIASEGGEMANRWLRGLLYVGVGVALLTPMFFLGDVITQASIGSDEFWSARTHMLGPDGWINGWAIYVLIAAGIVLLVYYLLSEGKPLTLA